MDRSNQPSPQRGHRPPQPLIPPSRFAWTRSPASGPPLSRLGDLTGRTVAELGCGSGHNLAYLTTHHAASGIGIDHDPNAIARATTAYGRLPGIAFRLADAADYLNSLSAATLDICLSIFGAFSFAAPQPLLTAVAHALKPGGLLAITLRADGQHDTVIVLRRR